MRVFTACLLCGLALQLIAHEINHAISDWALSLVLYGLPVAFAGLRLDFRDGWRVMVVLGLCADAFSPVHFGVHAILFLAAFAAIQQVRQRVAREEDLVASVFAVLATLVLHLALSLIYLWRGPAPWRMFERVLWELGLSGLVTAVLASWYFAFTEHLLAFFGTSLRREQRGLY